MSEKMTILDLPDGYNHINFCIAVLKFDFEPAFHEYSESSGEICFETSLQILKEISRERRG